ncbi:hypothetical protein [Saccharothrix syringae]|uniref:Uncharacterized protein n=1 Tax=Saccharothrix syringae TaxID=103733 RepID=A0A5Q0H3A8_SACSY|nr:hypothetical protein [Saccharothrix syringae]QFZ20747.1 hypothetical protein EKG83_28100 [Saccharothrix syringae]
MNRTCRILAAAVCLSAILLPGLVGTANAETVRCPDVDAGVASADCRITYSGSGTAPFQVDLAIGFGG